MTMDISVIVCTYNRYQNLLMLLESFEKLKTNPDIEWELIVVDNNSSDITRAVVESAAAKNVMKINYVFEGRQGKSYALNSGIIAAKGEIIAFTDDDCIVNSDWIENILLEFKSDENLCGIGGRVELYDKRDKPVTIMTSKEKFVFESSDRVFSSIHGCNMSFVRKVFGKTGFFDVSFFSAGSKIASAEDSDFIYRVFKSGLKMTYCPDVVVYHNHGRRTNQQVSTLMKGYTTGRGAFYCKHVINGDYNVAKMVYWEIKSVILTFLNDSHNSELRKKTLEHLYGLLVGVVYYLAAFFKRPSNLLQTSKLFTKGII
ncbi:MAG: glycosyltransferase family 2 protein [Proteobacteria bacterium]|nr:glycosyltransferase family 2 protein [Pseudomonadota bacterium]